MAINMRRAARIAVVAFFAVSVLLILNTILQHSTNNPHISKLRVEEPVVVILVHPSPSLNRAENFELKRAIARTWAKDVEDFGASVFFVGEHDGETVMRRPSEFQGRAQSLSMRFMDSTDTDSAEEGTARGKNGGNGDAAVAGLGGGGDGDEDDYSKQEPMRKMLIPSILENGQADGASGLLKAYHFLYNNTNWYAGPMLHTYPFILTTDTTHYIHVENLVTTLLSSRPRRLLTMRGDHSFTGSFSEASECSADDFGDKVPPVGYQGPTKKTTAPHHTHWTLSGTHMVSRQLVALIGPHLHQCVNSEVALASEVPVNKDASVSGEAFQECIQQWASHPLFWKNGYCGRFAALQYDASITPLGSTMPASFSHLGSPPPSSSFSSLSSGDYTVRRKEQRGILPPSPSPEDFETFYRMKQLERAQARQARVSEPRHHQQRQQEADTGNHRRPTTYNNDNTESDDDDESERQTTNNDNKVVRATPPGSSSATATTHWIVGSGLIQPEDFTFLYQSLIDREGDDPNDDDNDEE